MVGRDALLIAGSLVHRYRTRREGDAFFDFESIDYKVAPSTLSKASCLLFDAMSYQQLICCNCENQGLFARKNPASLAQRIGVHQRTRLIEGCSSDRRAS